jgi:hypothetical protein
VPKKEEKGIAVHCDVIMPKRRTMPKGKFPSKVYITGQQNG